MAKSDKELKPLLKKNHQQSQQQQTQPVPAPRKTKGKGDGGKSKLVSVSEAESEDSSVTSTQPLNPSKEERTGQCCEKDVDEAESKKPPSTAPRTKLSTPSGALHPQEHIILEHTLGEGGKQTIQAFGVKSYLHHFYESVSQTPQDENYQYLIQPKGSRCGAIWFKIGLIVGSTLFLLGAIAIVIGYAIPKQRVIMGISETIEVIDNDARRFNENLDRCKLIGLAGFCSGGLILVISLLSPTLTSTYWENEDSEPFRVSLSANIVEFGDKGPPSPKDCPIPATEKIKCIQPVWTD